MLGELQKVPTEFCEIKEHVWSNKFDHHRAADCFH